jgi:hypothetical protein
MRKRDLYQSDGMTQFANAKMLKAQRAFHARQKKRWTLSLHYDGIGLTTALVSGTKKEAMAKAEKVVASRPARTIGRLVNLANTSNMAAWVSLRPMTGNGRSRTLFTRRTLRLI